jgi:hypothetical protein
MSDDAAAGQDPQAGTAGEQTASEQATSQETASQEPGRGVMFSLGWQMSQLFGPLRPQAAPLPSGAGSAPWHLPTADELGPNQQTGLAVTELGRLIKACPGLSADAVKAAADSKDDAAFAAALQALHLAILELFVGNQQQFGAYQVGLALSDACWLPAQTGADFFLQEFDRHRMASLQAWLAEASAALPPQAAATVSGSLQNWQDWADINAAGLTGNWAADQGPVVDALHNQARSWHALLVGEADTAGQTSIDAWVEAGEAMLRSTRMLTLRVLRHFWPVVVIILAATGWLLYVANTNVHGTASVWASVVTVAGAFGLSGTSLRAAAKKAVSGIEADFSRAAVLDARAWGATWLPTLPQTAVQRYRLSGRGVAAPQAKPGLERPGRRTVPAVRPALVPAARSAVSAAAGSAASPAAGPAAGSAVGERADDQPGSRLGPEGR